MKVDRELVLHIATLARIELTEQEVELFTTQMGTILQYVEKLNEVTANLGSDHKETERAALLRDDSTVPSLSVDRVTRNAPDQKKNLFRVPRIMP